MFVFSNTSGCVRTSLKWKAHGEYPEFFILPILKEKQTNINLKPKANKKEEEALESTVVDSSEHKAWIT